MQTTLRPTPKHHVPDHPPAPAITGKPQDPGPVCFSPRNLASTCPPWCLSSCFRGAQPCSSGCTTSWTSRPPWNCKRPVLSVLGGLKNGRSPEIWGRKMASRQKLSQRLKSTSPQTNARLCVGSLDRPSSASTLPTNHPNHPFSHNSLCLLDLCVDINPLYPRPNPLSLKPPEDGGDVESDPDAAAGLPARADGPGARPG